MPDRTSPPPIRDINQLRLPDIQVHQLDNGIPLYEIQMGTQDVIKLEIVFQAGRPYERKQLAARATSSLLREGTRSFSAAQIAEQLDFYGCSLSFPFNLDTCNVILYSLNKHFDKLMPILEEILATPTFPEAELNAFIKRNQQRLEVDLAKNDIVSYRKFTEFIFGETHPYGYNSNSETYAALKRDDLLEHFSRLFNSSNCVAFISGRSSPEIIAMANERLSRAIPAGKAAEPVLQECPATPQAVKIQRPETVQTAIRIGRRLFNRQHDDYMGMYVLNTILGGYFGSRLMDNIREEKGYTYNIYSSLDPMQFDGYFYVGTEVGNEFVKDTLRQTYLEMDRLQQEPVDEEELAMVRNYLMGNFLTMLDGPFNVSEVIRTQAVEGLPLSYFESMAEAVRNITAGELQRLAQRYLRREDMWEVVVGV